jgi:hypothetical protein
MGANWPGREERSILLSRPRLSRIAPSGRKSGGRGHFGRINKRLSRAVSELANARDNR